MNTILNLLHELSESGYTRSIFNFYIKNESDKILGTLLEELKSKIELTDDWDSLWNNPKLPQDLLFKFKNSIQGIHLCLQDKTHIFRNPSCLTKSPDIKVKCLESGRLQFELPNKKPVDDMIKIYQTGKINNPNNLVYWVLRDKNPVISYLKTINRKKRTRFTELYKEVLNKPHRSNFSGIMSNEFQDDHITKLDNTSPWIKEYSTRLRLQMSGDKIISGGRTGLSQSIDITLKNKTCLILFKNGTFHALLSKKDNETFLEFINLILDVLEFVCLFQIIFVRADSDLFKFGACLQSVDRTSVTDTLKILDPKVNMFYPIRNLSLGILNIINTTMKMSKDFFIILKELNKSKQIKLYKPNYINFVVIKNPKELITLINDFHDTLKRVKKVYKQKRTNPLFNSVPDID
ncbi:intermediate transcription factor [Salmon gill poxvirus]